MTRHELCEDFGLDPEHTLFLPEEEFDLCIAGIDQMNECIVYYIEPVIQTFMKLNEWDIETAVEWFEYNVQGSVGSGFPTYIHKLGESK